MKIIEKIGRAGGFKQRQAKSLEWDKKHGKGRWEVVYFYEGKIYLRDEALEQFYEKSYYEFLKNNPSIARELCSASKELYNPHAENTSGVDLQVPAVLKALESLNMKLTGKERTAIGVWGTKHGKTYPSISYKLSPFKVTLWCDSNISIEEFWQEYKYLGVK